MSSLLRYSLLRFMLLLGVGMVAYVLGARGAGLVVIAFLGSGVISLVALRAPREDVARKVAERADPNRPRRGPLARISERIEAANRAEDEALDAAERSSAADGPISDGAGGAGEADGAGDPGEAEGRRSASDS